MVSTIVSGHYRGLSMAKKRRKDVAFVALEATGFSDLRLETVNSQWTVDDPGTPYDYFLEGTVRGAALLRKQSKSNQDAIRTAISEAVRLEFGSKGPWQVPIPAAIVSVTALSH